MKRFHRTGTLPWLLVLASCVSVDEEAGFPTVQGLLEARLEQRIHWRQGTSEDARAEREIDALLASPLTVEAAVQIALLENRNLQMDYERLGIARADLVQAGLLENPVFSTSVRLPDGSGSGTNLEFGLVQSFLDVLLRPVRREIARTRFSEAERSVAAAVVEFAAEVRRAYFEALGAEQAAALRGLIAEAAQASAELAFRLHEAGNISDLQYASELGLYEGARVAWARAEAERLAAREELTRHMGLFGTRVAWTLPDSLPELPETELALESLEARAIAGRLDLAAARKASEALAMQLGVTRDWRWLALFDLGVSTERDPDGQWVTGPELALELPLFDRRQGELARLATELRSADHHVIALAVEIRSEVRAARDRLLSMRRLVQHYRDVVIPVREAIVAGTQQEYDSMLVGAFELIAAKQSEYDVYHEFVEAVRDYWIARSELERALGGSPSTNHAPAPGEPSPSTEQAIEPVLQGHPHQHHGGS